MRVNLLDYVWKGTSGYSYGYVMITDKASIEDVIRDPRKKILWGGDIRDWYAARCALEKVGITIDAYTSVYERDMITSKYCTTVNFREVLKCPEDYFFIVVASGDPFRTREDIKLLQHHGVDELGIVYSGFTKDFSGRQKLQNAYFASVNEVFEDINFLNHWNDLDNCRRSALDGAGYFDVPLLWIYGLHRQYKDLKYFEVGPGLGTMMLTLKKVMDMDVTCLNFPDEEEEMWSAFKRDSSKKLFDKYNIRIQEGWLELDEFEGVYDIIVLAQVMEHFIYNPVNSFKKLRNLLSDRGFLFVSVPEDKRFYNVDSFKEMPFPNELTEEEHNRRTQINDFYHFHEYSYEEAMEAFEMSGLELVHHVLSGTIHHFMLKKA